MFSKILRKGMIRAAGHDSQREGFTVPRRRFSDTRGPDLQGVHAGGGSGSAGGHGRTSLVSGYSKNLVTPGAVVADAVSARSMTR